MTQQISLRDRYSHLIVDVTGSLHVKRVKLTPARVAAMKASLARTMAARRAIARQVTRQTRAARAFAAWAKRQGYDVRRVTFPDGARGSVYVRVNGLVIRFADHTPPWNTADGVQGGYSKRLGRRHRPADVSVCTRRRFSFEEARNAVVAATR